MAAMPDVTAKIQCNAELVTPAGMTTKLTSRDVCCWVMSNTVETTLHGVLEYCHRGLHFAATRPGPLLLLLLLPPAAAASCQLPPLVLPLKSKPSLFCQAQRRA